MLKLSFSIGLIVVLFVSETTAQNFFPFQIGNKFQYKINWSGGSGGGTNWGKLEVVQDSIINGKVFYKFFRKGIHFFEGAGVEDLLLFSYDSTEQKLYVKIPDDDTIRIAVDFSIPNGSTFNSYIQGLPLIYISEGIFADSIFGIQLQAFKMYYESSYHPRSFKFGDGFGIIHFYAMNVIFPYFTVYRDTLYSAIIDTNIYNPLSLEITSISPLIDRPIDAFPFVLYGSYSASVSKLVDSFYVNVLHTRQDSVLHAWRLDFNNGQVNIPIYTSMLHVGDVIKIKAKVTDESIFYNFDYYPDSGYALIHVLDPSVGIQIEESTFRYNLVQNYPNPFNFTTIIRYEIPEQSFVTIKFYDVLGKEIATLVNEEKPNGNYEVEFDGSGLTSGIYYYKFTAGEISQTKKMILLK